MDLKDRARDLRKNATDAEKKIWRYLRDRQLSGYKFHRQYVIGNYICDFVCRDVDLIIEIDGGQHCDNTYDLKRTSDLEREGYKVIRFWNNDVLKNIEGVMTEIENTLKTLTGNKALTPTLSLKGEGVLDQIPTPKSERWKFTNLPSALKKLDLTPASLGWGGDVALLNKDAPGADQYQDTQLWDLNGAQTKDIQFISEDTTLDIKAENGQWLSPRIIVHVKSGEEVTLIENQSGAGAYWKNQVVQIVLEANAKLNHYRFMDEGAQGVFTTFTHIKIARDARYEALNVISGAGTVRNQIHAHIQGENADCTLNGINLLSGTQHGDTTITIEHEAPHCTSNQVYKNIVTDSARGVFQGKVHVHKQAQKTDGYQLSNTLILSDLAEMDTKPELEIYADDVKCSHGATTGQLDEDPLFYLRARGIPESAARALLIEAFIGEALERVSREEIQDRARDIVTGWLFKTLSPINGGEGKGEGA